MHSSARRAAVEASGQPDDSPAIGVSKRDAAYRDADQHAGKAYTAAYEAHELSSRSHRKQHDPQSWDPKKHHDAADAHEEAAVHHEHAAKHADPSTPDHDGIRRDGEPERYSKEWHHREADFHNKRADHHRVKADIAQHMHDKQYGLAHDAAKKLTELPKAGALDDLNHKKILDNVARKTSKLPHNELVARDAEQEGKHDVAAKLRRMRKSEKPNVRRLG